MRTPETFSPDMGDVLDPLDRQLRSVAVSFADACADA